MISEVTGGWGEVRDDSRIQYPVNVERDMCTHKFLR